MLVLMRLDFLSATRADLMVLAESKPRLGLGSHQCNDVANAAEEVRRIE